MKHRSLFAFVASVSLLTACQGLKEALTAHVDVVARAESQELSVTRVADLLGKAKLPVPVTRDNAGIVANLWVNYQLLAHAAARGDSLTDREVVDQALAGITQSMRLGRYMDSLQKTFKVDSGSEATYAEGKYDLLAARHIIIQVPQEATPAQKDSALKKIQQIRPQVTSQNFAQMAGRYSQEPQAAQRGGSLGVFEKRRMVPEFSNAVAALKPGEISQPIESSFGYHIIQRMPYSEIKDQYAQQYAQYSVRGAESTYFAGVEKAAGIEVKNNAASLAKEAVRDPAKHRHNNASLATYKGGALTVAEFLNWLEGMNPQQRIHQQVQQAPDSLVTGFVKQVAQQEVLLAKADSAKIGLAPDEKAQMYQQFAQLVQMVWQNLGVDPKSLADSAKTPSERERIAAGRVEAFIDKVLAGQAQPVPVPAPLEMVLREKYQWSVNPAGLDRATESATKIRSVEDSTRAQNQPKSSVPLPGAPGSDSGARPPATKAPQPNPATKRP